MFNGQEMQRMALDQYNRTFWTWPATAMYGRHATLDDSSIL